MSIRSGQFGAKYYLLKLNNSKPDDNEKAPSAAPKYYNLQLLTVTNSDCPKRGVLPIDRGALLP